MKDNGYTLYSSHLTWEDLRSVFLEHFNPSHDIARQEYKTRLLDSHKLAALAIIAVKKANPILVWDTDTGWRKDNFMNTFFAIILAQEIMLNVRNGCK